MASVDRLASHILDAVRAATHGEPHRWVELEDLPSGLTHNGDCQEAVWRGFELGWFYVAGWGVIHSVAITEEAMPRGK